MPNTYTLIEKITVGAAGASSITFTSIPQTYTDLLVKISARSNRADTQDDIYVTLNGSTSSFTGKAVYGSGATAASYSPTRLICNMPAASATANNFGNTEFYIPNYTSSNYKSFSSDGTNDNNTTGDNNLIFIANLWSNTSAITSIALTPGTASFVQYSTFYLYGVAKEGVSPGTSSAPYATGGDSIVFDGTYWIHTFYSSGTFTPKKGLTCDYLVVAGGGGGGANAGGGGGAGGFRTSIGGSGLSCSASTNYTVTVGAGGSQNTKGSDSVFSTITSTGGGQGGSGNTNGSTGGSGGGSGIAQGTARTGGAGNQGSYSPVEGYAGGSTTPADQSALPAAGGGGAGAVGTNSAASKGGNGGNGASSSISGSSVTYGGGGGGCCYFGTVDGDAGAGGTGGGGQGGHENRNNGVAGTANTGGGGGGARVGTGGAGGSGIVIVRYAA